MAINYYKVALRVFIEEDEGPYHSQWEFLVHRDAKYSEFTEAVFSAFHLIEVIKLKRGPKIGQQYDYHSSEGTLKITTN